MRMFIILGVFLTTTLFLGDTLYVHAANPQTAPLIQQQNLNYEGAFKLPQGKIGNSTFAYGGNVLAYNPQNNSLFIVGHDGEQYTAEVTIPTPIVTTQEADLPTATVLQPFADPSDDKMYTIDTGGIKTGGLLATLDNKLYGSAYSYYDANHSQTLSHFISPLDISKSGDAQGMFKVGQIGAGFISGYMTKIPDEWQVLLGGRALTGNCCISIISRSSYGPAAFTFDPADLGQQTPVPVNPLVYYPSSNPLAPWDNTNPLFNGATKIRGLVLLKGSRSLLFFGKHGQGTWCYGTGGTNGDCYDPTNTNKGNHAYPYVNQVWAYDVLDLLDVKNGNTLFSPAPWEVKPYKVWQFTLGFQAQGDSLIAGITYDSSTQRIFIAQSRGGLSVIIHIFRSNHGTTGGDTTAPGPPQDLKLFQ